MHKTKVNGWYGIAGFQWLRSDCCPVEVKMFSFFPYNHNFSLSPDTQAQAAQFELTCKCKDDARVRSYGQLSYVTLTVNCNYRPTCGCPVWGGWRGWSQTEARAPPNGQTAALPRWPSCCGYAASTWKSIAWNKCEIMTDECRASCIRVLVFHTSHWALSPRSCSLDQMLWTLPACSGCRLLSPHVHWCFCIWASYTRPSTQTHRRFIPIGRRRHHRKMRLFMNGIETRRQFTPLVLCFPADEDKWVSPTGGKAQLAVCQRAGQWQWRQSGRRMWGGRHGGGRWGGLGPNQWLVS